MRAAQIERERAPPIGRRLVRLGTAGVDGGIEHIYNLASPLLLARTGIIVMRRSLSCLVATSSVASTASNLFKVLFLGRKCAPAPKQEEQHGDMGI